MRVNNVLHEVCLFDGFGVGMVWWKKRHEFRC